jgi:hypothetical protein
VSSTTASTIATKWNAATNAASYTLSWGTTADAKDGKVTVSTLSGTATGLKPNTLYHLRVQANPVKAGAGFASLTKTTAKTSTSSGGGTKTPPKPSGGHRTETISDAHPTLSSLVTYYNKTYKTKYTVSQIWNYNLQHRDADTVKTMKERGPDKVFHGTTFWFPS